MPSQRTLDQEERERGQAPRDRSLPVWPHGQWFEVPKYEFYDLLISAAMSQDPRCRTSATVFFEAYRTSKKDVGPCHCDLNGTCDRNICKRNKANV